MNTTYSILYILTFWTQTTVYFHAALITQRSTELKAVVGGTAGPAVAGPLFWPEMVLAGPHFWPNMFFEGPFSDVSSRPS